MGCGASKDRVSKDLSIAAEPAEVEQRVENLDRNDDVIRLGNSKDIDDYKRSPVTFKNQRGLGRNTQIRNSSLTRGISGNKNNYHGGDDIEELTLQENIPNKNQISNKYTFQNEKTQENHDEYYSPEKQSSKQQLNGFYLANGLQNRRQSHVKNRSREGSLSSESRNELSQLHVSLDTNMQVNRTSRTQIPNNLLNIQDQSQSYEPKTINLFQKKQKNQYQNNLATNILERDADIIEDLSMHLLGNNDEYGKVEKNTCATIEMDTNDNDNDPLFFITENKPLLQKAKEYIQFNLKQPPVLSHSIFQPDIDFTKENKQRQFNKDGIFNQNSSKKAQPIDKHTADGVRDLLFGNAQNKYLPKSWTQGFIINEQDMYGLIQKEGGPCGVIAVVQAYYIKYLLLSQKIDESQMKRTAVQENCLLAALAEIIYKCRTTISKNNYMVKFVIAKQLTSSSFKACDIGDCQVISYFPTKYEDVFNALREVKEELIGHYNNGVINFLYSIIVTRGVQNIINAMDIKFNSLIGTHGHATQELVNLLMTGESRSNCFDGVKELGSMKLYGIKKRQQIGFLSALECDAYIEVGQNYKNPFLPIWVLCKENHYTTLFARDCRIIDNNLWNKFDIIFYDQLSEQGSYSNTITIEKDQIVRNNKFNRENDVLDILSKHSKNILNVKWGTDISIKWPGNYALL